RSELARSCLAVRLFLNFGAWVDHAGKGCVHFPDQTFGLKIERHPRIKAMFDHAHDDRVAEAAPAGRFNGRAVPFNPPNRETRAPAISGNAPAEGDRSRLGGQRAIFAR